jgi:hypothetical protein
MNAATLPPINSPECRASKNDPNSRWTDHRSPKTQQQRFCFTRISPYPHERLTPRRYDVSGNLRQRAETGPVVNRWHARQPSMPPRHWGETSDNLNFANKLRTRMSRMHFLRYRLIALAIAAALTSVLRSQQLPATGGRTTDLTPGGALIVPMNPGLPDYPTHRVGQAVTSLVSPGAKTLLVLMSGCNLVKYPSGTIGGASNAGDSAQFILFTMFYKTS